MTVKQIIDNTKEKIIKALNESNLPVEYIDLILENIILTVRNQAQAMIANAEKEEPEKVEKEKEDGAE